MIIELTALLLLVLMGANTVMLVMCLASLSNIAENLTAIVRYADEETTLEDATHGASAPQAEVVSPGNVYMPERLADLLMHRPPTDLTNGTFEGRRPLGPPPEEPKT